MGDRRVSKFVYTEPEEVIKVATTKKATAKKTTARKSRARQAPVKMSPAVRELAAKVVATATESALASDKMPVKRQMAGELPGARSGMQARIVLEDGTRIRVQVVVS
jgi:hypothetical protein